jgi:alpha-galactosidase
MSVVFDKEKNIFCLNASQTTYLIKIMDGGEICHLYWGKSISPEKIESAETRWEPKPFCPIHREGVSFSMFPQEYPSPDSGDFREAAYEFDTPSGHMMSVLKYKSYEIFDGKNALPGMPATYVNQEQEAQTLQIVARDEVLGLNVTLQYTVFANQNVITRSVLFENKGSETVFIDKALSCSIDFEHSDFQLLHLPGAHAAERAIEIEPLTHGLKTIQSKRGLSSPQHNPFVALLEKGATEDKGNVYAFNFVYSGNFTAQFEVDSFKHLRAQMGINPYGFKWKLMPEESFQTPEVVMVYSDKGLGGMSRTFHRLYRNNLCRGTFKHKERPVLINSWEALYFDYTSDDIVSLARSAKPLGVELVVLDDGWFGQRNDEKSSLGDWRVDQKKIPEGIEGLAQRVRAEGVDFGIWLEPEMISPDSDLYRSHPDWCIHVPDRMRNLGRNQLVLDLTRQEVREYVIDSVANVLNCGLICYVKWDMNRHLCNIGSADTQQRPGEILHRYVLGLYAIMETLTTRFDDVLFESCAGGGGRYDPGMLYYMPQVWTSDNTDAICRIDIQKGTSLAYPAVTMGAHVSAVPNHLTGRSTPLKLRGDVAMMGNLGYELDPSKLTEEEKEDVAQQVEFYKSIRATVTFGDMYRLSDIQQKEEAVVQYISRDRRDVVVFCCGGQARSAVVFLQGLEADTDYLLGGEMYSGCHLMEEGLEVMLDEESHSAVIRLEKSLKKSESETRVTEAVFA